MKNTQLVDVVTGGVGGAVPAGGAGGGQPNGVNGGGAPEQRFQMGKLGEDDQSHARSAQ